MLRMENIVTNQNTHKDADTFEEEDGEILEDGEIDDDVNDQHLTGVKEGEDSSNTVVEEVVEQVFEEEELVASEEDEKRKHHKRSHRRRKKKHDDRRSEEKRSRHKRRKGEDGSDGDDSPPSKRRKKRKKHSRDKKDRGSSSPDNLTENQFDKKRVSESPPLPSEQSVYNYDAYDPSSSYKDSNNYNSSNYDPSVSYTGVNNSSKYSYDTETYPQEEEYSSGSDSYYSDFESHLKQYQSYKQNKSTTNSQEDRTIASGGENDNDNYYSVGYDAEQSHRRHRSNDEGRSNRRSQHRVRSEQNGENDERRRSGRREGRNSSQRGEQVVCRYFQEGHCGKGDKCAYSHQLGRNKDGTLKKIPELCHHYLNGYCHLGESCRYMHGDYPCKYFHTGTLCYNGEHCKFSHDPANDQTRDIIRQFQDAVNSVDDSKEIEALEKAGIKPLQKPPPGMGLLPTPSGPMGMGQPNQMPQIPIKVNKGKIPSLFDISVQPTPELQQKLDANNIEEQWIQPVRLFPLCAVPCLQMMDGDDNGAEMPSQPPPMPMPAPMFDPNNTGGGLLPLPGVGAGLPRPPLLPNFPPPPNFIAAPQGPPPMMMPVPPVTGVVPPNILPPGSATPPWIQRQKALLKQQQEEAKEYYDKLYAQPNTNSAQQQQQAENSQNIESKTSSHDVHADPRVKAEREEFDANDVVHQDDNDDLHNDDDKEKEDVIRIDDHGVIKDTELKAPDFLPPKQKALFMRIHQKRKLSNENNGQTNQSSDMGKETSADNWTYSSDEEDISTPGGRQSSKSSATSSESVQSIIKMISNKKTDRDSTVDTNLLSKVANVISVPPSASGLSHSNRTTYASTPPSSGKGMMSPPRQPLHRNERKGSGSDASPSHHTKHHPVRRRLSTSELNKDPVTIPLVTKQSSDSVHTSHPDPRMTLSRLFGKTKPEFRGPLPGFGKDVMMPGFGKMTGLKITLSSHAANPDHSIGDKRPDPRLVQAHRQRPGDPRVKVKPHDPRLRMRASSSATKLSPPRSTAAAPAKPTVPSKPTALLTKPSTSIIPSLPELNLDFASLKEHQKKSPKHSMSPSITKIGDPLASLPKLMRANVRPASSNRMLPSSSPSSTKESSPPHIAPYDPRYIASGVATTTAVSTPAPYDPRAMTSVPPLYDPRTSNQEVKKRTIQLPKLTPAPGYAAKVQETNGNSNSLPTGEAEDF